ncbi:Rrf2 family transcriptional regulator [Paenibacillus psychroresistens]|uniref:Rrf2 family transcriptional regulator n=1 Tax=Paenibacillus psychroresistens TaxID=1778678 RepID=A0A6B8RUW7_9BACL|nr:Rrf2 family transcriptional regulator [Paenibacillus psychroresistens]QGQ98928.1 Rrf2 family transcriptional regulator [Paenibacillus psychroresistens]
MKMSRINQIGPARFGIAVHALIWLAQTGEVLSSVTLANQVNSHATFLRRIMALLAQFTIVDSREGRDGGYYLKIPANKLTLAEIYMAVKGSESDEEIAEECGEAGKQLDSNLEAVMLEVEQKTIEVLQQYTLSDLMKDVDFSNKAK